MEEKLSRLLNEMTDYLSISQLKKLQEVAISVFSEQVERTDISNEEYMQMFLDAKNIEGCAAGTIQYYKYTIERLFRLVKTPIRQITADDLRRFLAEYQKINNCSKCSLNNLRRNLSSFFVWLEEENHILKSPMRRIHNIKTNKVVKEVISEDDMEKLRDGCTELRDLVIIDLLYSSGIRISELVSLNKSDINFDERECVVFGKGGKERKAYFDAKTKNDLEKYLKTRTDNDPSLFVTLRAPFTRVTRGGIESKIRKLSKLVNSKIHPHKFRRSMATRALNKGMPIEQVQKLLGHSKLDTTLIYAQVSQDNVKTAHQKFLG